MSVASASARQDRDMPNADINNQHQSIRILVMFV
jgi:hypothetical protein